ncbi:MAG: anhydro-N-acetylmuramic acid kinase [Flavobacterium sp.]|nr:anhydro-N-acetylmuramic acid kinase [Pedobacter sp.]
MNYLIEKLFKIALKPERKIIGLMSGTSLDGLDIALCSCSGSGSSLKIKVLKFKTVAYDTKFREEIKSIFSRRDADIQQVCILNELIGIRHGEMILDALQEWKIVPEMIDLIASHGQTIYHAPKLQHKIENYPNATLQIGDGDHIAVKTGIITLSDFRQKHIAAGGEGAPLAVYGDYLMFSNKDEDRVMLNIGGISNFTYLPASGTHKKILSTDVGPGNTLMDQFIQQIQPGSFFDKDAQLALSGTVNIRLLKSLSNHGFFKSNFPKTTGPELFNLEYLNNALLISETANLSNKDIMATLCRFTANEIISAIERCCEIKHHVKIYLSGGGMHNPLLLKYLKAGLQDATFKTTLDLGIHPDAKEAVLFAVLANETVAGSSADFGGSKEVPSIGMGKISLPK